MSGNERPPIPAPWVLIDDLTVGQAADLLERLTGWLTAADPAAAAACASALSLGETDDPVSIASWADAVAGWLRHRAQEGEL